MNFSWYFALAFGDRVVPGQLLDLDRVLLQFDRPERDLRLRLRVDRLQRRHRGAAAVTRMYPPVPGSPGDMRMPPAVGLLAPAAGRQVAGELGPEPLEVLVLVLPQPPDLRRPDPGGPPLAVLHDARATAAFLPSGILMAFGSGNRAIGVVTGLMSRSGK